MPNNVTANFHSSGGLTVNIHSEDEPPVCQTIVGRVHIQFGSNGNVWVTADHARTLAAGLMIAADELDPQTDDPEVARTLRIAMNGGAA